MGGSIVVDACPSIQEAGYKVAGVAVIDVVEGPVFCFKSWTHLAELS